MFNGMERKCYVRGFECDKYFQQILLDNQPIATESNLISVKYTNRWLTLRFKEMVSL